MITNKLIRRRVQYFLNPSVFYFWLIYCILTFNSSDADSRKLDNQKNAKLENSTTDNSWAF